MKLEKLADRSVVGEQWPWVLLRGSFPEVCIC
jgi:hypothetical protein